MKKVFILTNTLKSGGAEKQSIYLTRALQAHYDVTLLVYYGDQFDQRMTALLDGVENQVVWLKGNHISKIVKVYKLFKEYRNAVVISYLATTNVINAIVGSLAGIKCKIGGIRSSKHHPAKLFIQRVLHNQILTNSVVNNYCGLENLIQKGFREDKCTVIHNGIPVNIGVQIREHTKNLNLLTVGRFIPAKDYYTALGTFSELVKNISSSYSLTYTIVGSGSLKDEFEKYAELLNVSKMVEFIISPREVESYFKRADIYLSTSVREGISNSIMEAMLYSLPVVATYAGDNNKLILDGHTGYLLPVKDTKGLAEKLTELVKDPALRHFLGVNGFNHLRDNFSLEKMTEEYVSLIERLSNEKKV